MSDQVTLLIRYRQAVLAEDWVQANAWAESARLHGSWTEEMVLRHHGGTPIEGEVQALIMLGIDEIRREIAAHKQGDCHLCQQVDTRSR